MQVGEPCLTLAMSAPVQNWDLKVWKAVEGEVLALHIRLKKSNQAPHADPWMTR